MGDEDSGADCARHSSATTWVLAAILAAPVIYVLSIGGIGCAVGARKLSEPLPSLLESYVLPYFWVAEKAPLGWRLQQFAEWTYKLGESTVAPKRP